MTTLTVTPPTPTLRPRPPTKPGPTKIPFAKRQTRAHEPHQTRAPGKNHNIQHHIHHDHR